MNKSVSAVKQEKTDMRSAMKTILELEFKIVEGLASLKMTELATKAAAEKNVSNSNPVWLWTLPDGIVTGDGAKVGDYYAQLVVEKLEDTFRVNYIDVIKHIIAELDKLTVEIVGEH